MIASTRTSGQARAADANHDQVWSHPHTHPLRASPAADKITKSISAYTAKLDVSPEKAYELYKTHGTCLKGMLAEGIIDKDAGVEDFLHKVHLIDYSDIEPDPELAAVLGRITKPAMWVFTASTVEHATRCMEAVGLTQLPIKGRPRPACLTNRRVPRSLQFLATMPRQPRTAGSHHAQASLTRGRVHSRRSTHHPASRPR